MKYFGLIALIFIFQSIHFSNACYGYSVELTDYKNGENNIVKVENGAKFEMTSDCRVIAAGNATIGRSITSALVSFKALTNSVQFVTVNNIDLCKAMSDFNIIGVGCPPLGPGRTLVGVGGDLDFSSYGPFIGNFVGNFTALVRVCYDGDKGGYNMDLVEVQSGPNNNAKFKEIIEANVTDDCRTIGSAYVTIERPFTSALISIKIRQGSTDLFTIRNKELCTYLSNIDIIGLNCPTLEAHRNDDCRRNIFNAKRDIAAHTAFNLFLKV